MDIKDRFKSLLHKIKAGVSSSAFAVYAASGLLIAVFAVHGASSDKKQEVHYYENESSSESPKSTLTSSAVSRTSAKETPAVPANAVISHSESPSEDRSSSAKVTSVSSQTNKTSPASSSSTVRSISVTSSSAQTQTQPPVSSLQTVIQTETFYTAPETSETESETTTLSTTTVITTSASTDTSTTPTTTTAKSTTTTTTTAFVQDFPADINTISREGLMQIPGVGETTADDIIRLRDSLGGIHNIAQLSTVYGIGENRLGQLDRYLYVSSDMYEDLSPPETDRTSVSSSSTFVSERTPDSSEERVRQPVDINTADEAELMEKLLLSEEQAREIIELRSRIIYFSGINELTMVLSMTTADIQAVEDFIIFGIPPDSSSG